mmetsp:Transcript_1115/g.2302  ORF Transcript_1115/g.2302 Transcript_1115/m.2302 type:complete len:487 (+) Transcript_1115:97-1557(+)
MLYFDAWDVLLFLAAAFGVYQAPFTKVEESFNLQAAHDFLYRGTDLQHYDHLEFPGVVPRTFLGACMLALCSAPSIFLAQAYEAPKLVSLYIVRCTLALGTVASLARFRRALRQQYGATVAAAFAVVYLVQFHPLYYAGRTLPNVFASIVTTFALADWVRGEHHGRALGMVTMAMVVFRCDVLLLLAPLALWMMITKKQSPLQVVAVGMLAGASSLALTVAFDSFFWRRVLWPEGEVLWFNTYENKSQEWGVMPFHWYFTVAMPKMLLAPLLLTPLGVYLDRRLVGIFVVAISFVLLYSNLPHKELRFLFPVVPLFNTCAAVAIARFHQNAMMGKRAWQFMYFLCIGALLVSLAASLVFMQASKCNYPGGEALLQLHKLHSELETTPTSDNIKVPSVHIGVFPAMSGISRFGELGASNWTYSKEENIPLSKLAQRGFDYLISAEHSVYGYTRWRAVNGFHRLQVVRKLPFIRVLQAPKVFIHKRGL